MQDWFDDQDANIQSRLHAKNQLIGHISMTQTKSQKAKRECHAIYGRQSSTVSAPLKNAKGEHLSLTKGRSWRGGKNIFTTFSIAPPQSTDRCKSIYGRSSLEKENKAIASLTVGKAPGSPGTR